MGIGWIKLHRKIVHHELWNDVTTFRLFMFLLINATHQETSINGVKLNRGQYLRSYSKLADDLAYKEGRGLKKVSKSTIYKSVKKLIDNDMVTVQDTELGTVFTIVNYEHYQGFDDGEGTEVGTVNGTNGEQSGNEGRTNGERTANHNKNVKNDKNEKNIKKTNVDEKSKTTKNINSIDEVEAFVDLKINDLPSGV